MIRVYSFEPYGLNKYRNFLDEDYFILSDDGIINYCAEKLDDEIFSSAIFIHRYDERMWMIMFDEIEDKYSVMEANMPSMDFFGLCDAQYRFFQYGLIFEVRPHVWKVIDEVG